MELFERREGLAEVHRDTYRIFCVIAGILSPIFGVVYQITDPDAVDPMWARFVLALASLLLLSFSYMLPWVERHFIVLVRGYFYLLMVSIIGLTVLNEFSYQYALGLLFGFMAMGVAFSLGLSAQTAPLVRFLITIVALTVGTALLIPAPEANVWIVWICVAATALVIYVVARAKVRADESVAASEHRYQILMNAASDAIFTADPGTGILIDANQKAQELIGRTPQEIRDIRLAELFPLEERERYTAQVEAHIFRGEPITEDLFVVDRSGEIIAVDISASLVDVDGRKLIQGIFRRHRYEEQLIQAKERAEDLLKLKTSLLNNMSHELRTPLTAILGFAEVLEEEVEGDQREHAQVITASARRLYDTLTSVLGLAQLESGDSQVVLRPVDVPRCVHASTALLRPLADQRGVTLRVVSPDEPPHAQADEAGLGRVINNLVGNAIKFTEDGGRVTVAVDTTEAHTVLRVEDTGVGIGPDFLPHLFEEFQQESSGIARSHEGSGLGLAITKRLVELMGGTIEVESAKGIGSTFTVTLSRGVAERTVETERPMPSPPPAPHLRRVLLVEDNANTRRLVAHRLGVFCHVEVAADPDTALELATRSDFDAFVLDINLTAAQDGVDLLHTLRRIQRYQHTPSVALTAYAMPEDEARFLGLGFDYYLSKPFTKEQLFRLMHEVFPTSSVDLHSHASGAGAPSDHEASPWGDGSSEGPLDRFSSS